MTAIEHIMTLSSAPWVMWMMLFLLVMLVIANIHQPKIMLMAWQMVFSRTDRVYDDASVVGISSLQLRFFCLLTAAFSWTLFFYKGGAFTFGHYMLITVCVLVWYLLRWGIRALIFWKGKLSRYGFPEAFMMSLCLVLTTALYIINIGVIWIPGWLGWPILLALNAAAWLVIIFIRHYQYFVHNWKTFLGLIAYWLVVEVGSLVGLFFLIREL